MGRSEAQRALKLAGSRLCAETARFFSVAIALLAGVAPAFAQPADDAAPIVVYGVRERFGITPERTVGPEDIASYGLDSIGELLDEVAAENGETSETSDQAVILINGKRTAAISNVTDLPPEAIAQIDVLPRGAGPRVGESATRRVYNIVLKRKFNSVAMQAAASASTDGERLTERGSLTGTDIRGKRRVNGAVKLRQEHHLLESDRDIIQPAGSPAGLGRFRTLLPAGDGAEASVTAADQLTPWLNASGELRLKHSNRETLLGLSPLARSPLFQEGRTIAISGNAALSAEVGQWLLSAFTSIDSERQRTRSDRENPLDFSIPRSSRTLSRLSSGVVTLNATGPLIELPAGFLRLTLGATLSRDALSRERQLFGQTIVNEADSQWTRGVSAAIELPIASRSRNELRALGDLTLDAEWNRTRVGRFSSLGRRVLSLNWQPTDRLRFSGSLTDERTLPSLALRSAPMLETPGVRVLDPLLGTTVDVTEISGGSPYLQPSRSIQRLLSMTWRPLPRTDLRLSAEYVDSRSRNLTEALPALSAAVLKAFPGRFVRDTSGALTQIYVGPVQFDRLDERRLRIGFNLSMPIGSGRSGAERTRATPTKAEDDSDVDALPAPRGGRPRLQFSINHALLIDSKLVIRPDLAPIDLLSGNAIGLAGAARPRHSLNAIVGYSQRGLGIRLSAQYRGASRLSLATDAEGPELLRFGKLTTFSLRAFASGERLLPRSTFARGSRITLSVANLANERERVTDSLGQTSIAYQAGYRDPLGRTIELSYRKLF